MSDKPAKSQVGVAWMAQVTRWPIDYYRMAAALHHLNERVALSSNAPPASVLACASLIAQATIDVLMERFEFEDEVIDVYRPLPETPFDRVGRYRRPVPKPT